MLDNMVNTGVSLLEYDKLQINLLRWMHQCELLKRCYQACEVLVIQQTSQGYEVIVSAPSEPIMFAAGTLLTQDSDTLNALLQTPIDGKYLDLSQQPNLDLVDDFQRYSNLLVRPLAWPDSRHFGFLCVLDPKSDAGTGINQEMLEPFQILLQQDLSLFCQSQHIESLSMRDVKTGMLNHQGFVMMAPRQLNLGRRFGAHAGVLFFELKPSPDLDQRHHTLLGSILQNTVRTADIAAHYSATQYIVLVFLHSEKDLHTIIKRIKNQCYLYEEKLELNVSYSFFCPDSNVRLTEMIAQAKNNLPD